MNRKNNEDIERQILVCLFNSEEDSLSVNTLSKWINSNWLTTLKFCRRLNEIGAIKLIEVEGKTVGVKLNTEAYSLIDSAFWEAEVKEPAMFRRWVDKRLIIVDKNIIEALEREQEK